MFGRPKPDASRRAASGLRGGGAVYDGMEYDGAAGGRVPAWCAVAGAGCAGAPLATNPFDGVVPYPLPAFCAGALEPPFPLADRGAEPNAVGSSFLCVGVPASNPAAMTVTRTSSPSESSITVPKMMLASGCAASCTSDAASLISNRPRSEPPAIDSSTPCAPSIDASSSGELIAFPAACTARPSPRDDPMPISALPAPDMTDLTSAKSRLIRPGVVIRFVMPCTPERSTSSAERNASISETPTSPSCSSRSLGITISVSHSLRSEVMPSSA